MTFGTTALLQFQSVAIKRILSPIVAMLFGQSAAIYPVVIVNVPNLNFLLSTQVFPNHVPGASWNRGKKRCPVMSLLWGKAKFSNMTQPQGGVIGLLCNSHQRFPRSFLELFNRTGSVITALVRHIALANLII